MWPISAAHPSQRALCSNVEKSTNPGRKFQSIVSEIARKIDKPRKRIVSKMHCALIWRPFKPADPSTETAEGRCGIAPCIRRLVAPRTAWMWKKCAASPARAPLSQRRCVEPCQVPGISLVELKRDLRRCFGPDALKWSDRRNGLRIARYFVAVESWRDAQQGGWSYCLLTR